MNYHWKFFLGHIWDWESFALGRYWRIAMYSNPSSKRKLAKGLYQYKSRKTVLTLRFLDPLMDIPNHYLKRERSTLAKFFHY